MSRVETVQESCVHYRSPRLVSAHKHTHKFTSVRTHTLKCSLFRQWVCARTATADQDCSPTLSTQQVRVHALYMNNHMHRAPFSDIESKKKLAKSKERRKEIHTFINYTITSTA